RRDSRRRHFRQRSTRSDDGKPDHQIADSQQARDLRSRRHEVPRAEHEQAEADENQQAVARDARGLYDAEFLLVLGPHRERLAPARDNDEHSVSDQPAEKKESFQPGYRSVEPE